MALTLLMAEATIHRTVHRCLLLLCLAPAWLPAQRVDWVTRVSLYGDNTEFFTPYRTGETILGGQVESWIEGRLSRRHTVRAGVFADHRFGSGVFSDSVKPIVAFRHQTTRSLGVVGTLESSRRHGLLDALMVSTRELTTPIEYGLQWREQRKHAALEGWVNWQRLNTPAQREQFEMGLVGQGMPTDWLVLHAQHLWSHRGGQLHDAGVPVTNNRVTAAGVEVRRKLPVAGRTSLAGWKLWSDGHLDPDYPSGRPATGRGTLIRAAVRPGDWAEVFALHWRGRDFAADAGDPNYWSAGKDGVHYRRERRYTEVGAMRRTLLGGGVEFDAEVRWHRIDDEDSIAFFGTPWELSYRVVVRAPLRVRIQ